jgi:hypothetical protein
VWPPGLRAPTQGRPYEFDGAGYKRPSRFFASSRLGGEVKGSGTILGIFSLVIPAFYFGQLF